jgi:ankyrin repeat protein
MRRDHSKFQVYSSLVINSSRFSKPSILTSSVKTLKTSSQKLFEHFSPVTTISELQKAKEIIKSVKLPKINFSLSNNSHSEAKIPVSPYRESVCPIVSNSSKLMSIYESINNLEKSISTPKPLLESSLLQASSDWSQVSKDFFSAIRMNKEMKVMKMLKRKKSLVGIRDSVGKTPLHWAVIRNNLPIAQLLINFGADPNAEDFFNRPVKHFAEVAKNREAMELLARFN